MLYSFHLDKKKKPVYLNKKAKEYSVEEFST